MREVKFLPYLNSKPSKKHDYNVTYSVSNVSQSEYDHIKGWQNFPNVVDYSETIEPFEFDDLGEYALRPVGSRIHRPLMSHVEQVKPVAHKPDHPPLIVSADLYNRLLTKP